MQVNKRIARRSGQRIQYICGKYGETKTVKTGGNKMGNKYTLVIPEGYTREEYLHPSGEPQREASEEPTSFWDKPFDGNVFEIALQIFFVFLKCFLFFLDTYDKVQEEERLKLHGTRERDWTGWTNYGWSKVLTDIRGKSPVRFALRPEPENQYDPFAIAIDAISEGGKVHIGYVPASHAEEATELLEWGRNIEVNVAPRGQRRAPEVTLHLTDL